MRPHRAPRARVSGRFRRCRRPAVGPSDRDGGLHDEIETDRLIAGVLRCCVPNTGPTARYAIGLPSAASICPCVWVERPTTASAPRSARATAAGGQIVLPHVHACPASRAMSARSFTTRSPPLTRVTLARSPRPSVEERTRRRSRSCARSCRRAHAAHADDASPARQIPPAMDTGTGERRGWRSEERLERNRAFRLEARFP